jgi:dUTP pyrophosphatase
MVLKVKKLSELAVLPKYAKVGDACMDLTVARVVKMGVFKVKYEFDLAFEIPSGYYIDVRSRSSVCKSGMILSNGCGVVDSGYRGNVSAVFYRVPFFSRGFEVGERCCQMMVLKVPNMEVLEVENLAESERGVGGYGSTGKY